MGVKLPKVFCRAVCAMKKCYNLLMTGVTLTFTKKVASGTDAMNNPTYTDTDISVDNCLIAPIIEPVSVREQQAQKQNREQVRIHLPKTSDDDVGDSTVVWDGKVFHVDSSSTKFMDENTPGDWDRYFRAELVNG
jgi:hypothetical protein